MTKKVNITIVAIIVIISLAISIYIPNKDRLSGKKEDTSKNYQTIEENGKVVSSVQMAIIESLTHNIRPFAVIENVVTHIDYRRKGYASTLLDKASEIAKEHRCYKAFLETGSNKESTLNFYRKNGFEIDKKHSCLKRL